MANAWTETARYETPVFDAEIIAHHPDRRIAGAYQCNPGSVVQSDGVLISPVVYACNISSVGPVVPFSAETHMATREHRTSRPMAALVASLNLPIVITGFNAVDEVVRSARFHDQTDAENLSREMMGWNGIVRVTIA